MELKTWTPEDCSQPGIAELKFPGRDSKVLDPNKPRPNGVHTTHATNRKKKGLRLCDNLSAYCRG